MVLSPVARWIRLAFCELRIATYEPTFIASVTSQQVVAVQGQKGTRGELHFDACLRDAIVQVSPSLLQESDFQLEREGFPDNDVLELSSDSNEDNALLAASRKLARDVRCCLSFHRLGLIFFTADCV